MEMCVKITKSSGEAFVSHVKRPGGEVGIETQKEQWLEVKIQVLKQYHEIMKYTAEEISIQKDGETDSKIK